MIYEVESLISARKFLQNSSNKITLTNPEGSTRYYGMRVVDYMFKILQQEFPNKVEGVLVNAYDDCSAFITAKQLGYKKIIYLGA